MIPSGKTAGRVEVNQTGLTPRGGGIIIEPEKLKTPGELVWTG